MAEKYTFEFIGVVSLADAEQTLHLAMFAVEGLVGAARVRLDCRYELDELRRVIVITGAADVVTSLVRVFSGLLLRELGEDAFTVHLCQPEPLEACA